MPTPKEVFDAALKLQEGEEIKVSFKTAKRLDSFRVSLYREKTSVKDETVLIAKKSGALFLKKGIKEPLYDEISFEVRKEEREEEDWNETIPGDYEVDENNDNCKEEPEFLNTVPQDIRDSYKTISGVRVSKIRSLMTTVLADEFKALLENLEEEKIKISLNDALSEPEKEALRQELYYSTNTELEKLGSQRRKIIKEMV